MNKNKRVSFTGSELEKKEVNKEVKWTIKAAKLKNKNKAEQEFIRGNLCSAWQGLKSMNSANTAASSPTTSLLTT